MKKILMIFLMSFLSLGLIGCDHDSDGGGSNVTRVLCLGDSITRGFGGATPYAVFLADFLGVPVIPAGRDGRTTGQGLILVRSLINQHNPSHVVVLLGTNDALLGLNATQAGANLQAIIDIIRDSGKQAIVCTLPPIDRGNSGPHGRTISQRIRSLSGATIVNLEGEVPLSTMPDGVHPNNDGQRIIAAALDRVL